MNPTTRNILMSGAVVVMITSLAWAEGGLRDNAFSIPDVEALERMGTQPNPTAEPGGYLAPRTGPSNSVLYRLTPNELRRGEVLDPSGEKVGTIKTVVADPETENVHAVITSGGILGLGARDLVVSFDELQVSDNKVQVTASKKELQERGEYVPEEYVELEPNRPISEFSAFEPTTGRPVERPDATMTPEPPPAW